MLDYDLSSIYYINFLTCLCSGGEYIKFMHEDHMLWLHSVYIPVLVFVYACRSVINGTAWFIMS